MSEPLPGVCYNRVDYLDSTGIIVFQQGSEANEQWLQIGERRQRFRMRPSHFFAYHPPLVFLAMTSLFTASFGTYLIPA